MKNDISLDYRMSLSAQIITERLLISPFTTHVILLHDQRRFLRIWYCCLEFLVSSNSRILVILLIEKLS
jgi:hypothetical protein